MNLVPANGPLLSMRHLTSSRGVHVNEYSIQRLQWPQDFCGFKKYLLKMDIIIRIVAPARTADHCAAVESEVSSTVACFRRKRPFIELGCWY